MSSPPDVTIPVPPAGFVPVPAIDLRGYRPLQSELATVSDAILELKAIPNWSQIFGITADDPTDRLQVASDWTGIMSQTDDWYSYVKSQEGMAWKDALEVMSTLKTPYQYAATANPALLRQYPALSRLLGAQTVVAKRAASTRKKNAAAAAAAPAAGAAAAGTGTAATGAAAAAAPVAAASAPVVGAVTGLTATTPARVVTVSG